ncbi:MAG: DUF4167 domain-containing protein [Hyphomicrobiales bacterium]
MRQAQSNRRGRGRSRKAQNPLTKNYESNGPDVKIRGTAAHISEKYNSLARDAQTSGDIVRQENYFQHAEHYNRIIAAAQQNNQSNADKSDDQTSQSDETDQQNASSGKGRNDGGRSDGRKNNNRRRRPDTRAQKSNGDASEAEATASQTDETVDNSADKKSETSDGKDTKPRGRGRRRSEPKVEMIAPEQSEAPVADSPASETPIIENNADDAAA